MLLQQSSSGQVQPVSLVNPAGTLWRGAGQLFTNGQPAGQLTWRVTPSSLLQGKAGADIDLALTDPSGGNRGNTSGGELTGNIAANHNHALLNLAGSVTGSWVSQWLAEYEVSVGGQITTSNLKAELNPNQLLQTLAATGDLTWSGGLVSYRIGNTLARQRLGSMKAVITGDMAQAAGLSAEVFGQESYPLLILALLPNGYVKVSITQRLTEIVGSPWPGSEQGHEFVLVVEQAVF